MRSYNKILPLQVEGSGKPVSSTEKTLRAVRKLKESPVGAMTFPSPQPKVGWPSGRNVGAGVLHPV